MMIFGLFCSDIADGKLRFCLLKPYLAPSAQNWDIFRETDWISVIVLLSWGHHFRSKLVKTDLTFIRIIFVGNKLQLGNSNTFSPLKTSKRPFVHFLPYKKQEKGLLLVFCLIENDRFMPYKTWSSPWNH